MILSGINSPPGEVDTVIETLTTGQMILSGTNSPPGELDTGIETLTTGQMILSGTNSLPGEVDTVIDLVPEGIICPVVSVSITVSTSPGGLLVPESII
jgi:hypothetical protein